MDVAAVRSYEVLREHEWRAWRSLFEKTLVLVRRPILALESLLFMTLGLVELMSDDGDAQPERWITRATRENWPAATVGSWSSFIAHLKQTRDFRERPGHPQHRSEVLDQHGATIPGRSR